MIPIVKVATKLKSISPKGLSTISSIIQHHKKISSSILSHKHLHQSKFYFQQTSRRWIRIDTSDQSGNDTTLMSLEDFANLTPHDVERELHKIKRKMSLLHSQGKYHEFLECATDLELKVDKVMGKNNVVYASCVNNLALAQKLNGKNDEAMDTYIHSLQLYEDRVGKNHPSYAAALANLGVLYKDMAEASSGMDKLQLLERAEEALNDAYKIRQDINAPAKDIIMSRNYLASLQSYRGYLDKANALLRQSVEEAKSKLGERNLLTATTLNNLAYVLKLQGCNEGLKEAQCLYEEALDIRSESLPPDHPDVIVSMNNLAELHIKVGNTEEATIIQKSIIQRMEESDVLKSKDKDRETGVVMDG